MNDRIASIPPSIIRSINALKKPGDIDFGLGEPTLTPGIDAFVGAADRDAVAMLEEVIEGIWHRTVDANVGEYVGRQRDALGEPRDPRADEGPGCR